MNVLGHTHAPENHAGGTACKRAGYGFKCFSIDTADSGHFFWWEIHQVRAHLVPAFREALYVLHVKQFFDNDGVHDRVEHRDIGTGFELQAMCRVTSKTHTAWIHDNEFAATFDELFEIGGCYRMIFNRVCTDHDRTICIFNFVERGGHRTRAYVFKQCSD